MICVKLKFVNPYGEIYYFVALGHRWDEDPKWQGGPDPLGRRLMRSGTKDINKARCFDTAAEALAILEQAGNPSGWSVLAEDKP